MAEVQALTSGPLVPALLPESLDDKYRGAVVEDLQLPPAFALHHEARVLQAIELAYDRDFSQIPILSQDRRPLGYVDVAALKLRWESGTVQPDDSILTCMTKFRRQASGGYTLITPWSPLAVLEHFLESNLFALVTDHERTFVLAVATTHDLENFVTRRGK